ncbi:MAG: DUF2878 family protein, partial [Nitrospirota bacterium]|nr:DUF2878 family protein [Nitrospirota bacterium]
ATVPEWQQAVRRILFIGLLEMFVCSILGFVGGLQYRDGLGAGWVYPLWVVFATTLKRSLGWREGRYAAEALVEGIFGPLNYDGGHAAGALRVRGDLVDGLLVLMVLWTVLLPGLLWLGTASNLKPKMVRG